MQMDYARGMIWGLSELTGGPFPPYFLEIVMKDGQGYYVHSGNSRDEKTQSVVVNIYDFRAMSGDDENSLKAKLEKLTTLPDKLSELHPSLSNGLLRCRLEDILYVAQWERYRLWNVESQSPETSRKKMGFMSDDKDAR
jgi:hypothetical protein